MRLTRVGFLALLLALSLAQATQAALGISERLAVTSWDSPATQHHDELATQAVPWADAAGETLAQARAAAATGGALRPLPDAPATAGLTLSSGITRAPPAA